MGTTSGSIFCEWFSERPASLRGNGRAFDASTPSALPAMPESFFVRHAYFSGADEPHKKLQRALKAEIDEDAWASLYSTISRPFDPPPTGKIAVKVINHYGDEVLKVYECRTTTQGPL